MDIEAWIDALCAVWEVSDGRGGLVRSYRLCDDSTPQNLIPNALGDFPCALTFPTGVRSEYSLGGPAIDLWRGFTEFHLFPHTDKDKVPEVVRYMARIRNAAAGNITLGGKVTHFLLRKDVESVQGPLRLQYGSEEPHWGLMANWEVKANVTGAFTVSA